MGQCLQFSTHRKYSSGNDIFKNNSKRCNNRIATKNNHFSGNFLGAIGFTSFAIGYLDAV